ncbi:MAG: PaaI family thioesterase [Pseudomonadota bacterium]
MTQTQTQSMAPRDPDFADRIAASFVRQAAMRTLGIELRSVAPGLVVLAFDAAAGLGQQHGFVHGGVLATALDSACGYAALSLSDAGAEVLTVEFKVNFLAPAAASRFVCEGRVLKSGRTLTVCEGQARDSADVLVATMNATMILRHPNG